MWALIKQGKTGQPGPMSHLCHRPWLQGPRAQPIHVGAGLTPSAAHPSSPRSPPTWEAKQLPAHKSSLVRSWDILQAGQHQPLPHLGHEIGMGVNAPNTELQPEWAWYGAALDSKAAGVNTGSLGLIVTNQLMVMQETVLSDRWGLWAEVYCPQIHVWKAQPWAPQNVLYLEMGLLKMFLG